MELGKLECELSDSYKRNIILLQLRTVTPEIYTAVASNTEMGYTSTLVEVKNLAALNGAVDQSGGGGRMLQSILLQDHKEEGKEVDPTVKPVLLVFGGGASDCRLPEQEGGGQSKTRSDDTHFKSGYQG